MVTQTFTIDHGLRTKVWSVIRILVCFVIVGILAYTFQFYQELEEDGVIYVFYGIIVFFVFSVFYLGKGSKNARRTDVSLDDDGIWYRHEGKDFGLVPWGTIEEIRDAPVTQRLELIGAAGHVMIRVSYDVIGFEELRGILVERACGEPGSTEFPMIYSSAAPLILGVLIVLVMLPIAGWTVFGENQPWGYCIFVVGLVSGLVNFLFSPHRLTLNFSSFELKSPIGSVTVGYGDIESVEIADRFKRGFRYSSVAVCSKLRARPVMIGGFQIDTVELKSILRRLMDEATTNTLENEGQKADSYR